MSDIINVGLYGGKGLFGGKETPLEASIVHCSNSGSCSYFNAGTCLNVRSPSSTSCRFGTVETAKGYTKRASKYYEFRDKWEKHEKYSKLKAPETKLGLIGDFVVFPYPYIRIVQTDEGGFKVTDPGMGRGTAIIPYKDFAPELILQICTFRPQAILGGTIDSHQKESVPLFIAHLAEVLPNRYAEFITAYPAFNTQINYVGRKAKLATLNPSEVKYRTADYPRFNEDWYWDGELLHYREGFSGGFRIVKSYDIVDLKIKPSSDAVVIITSNDQVSSKTVFVN